MSFSAYPGYKDSGMAWLGAIPEHWLLYRSKNVFSERNIKALESDEQLTASQKYGVIPQKLFSELEGQKVMQVILGRDILKKAEVNDFVISMRSFQGGLEFSSYSGAVSSAYVPLYANRELNNSFFKHLFKSVSFISALQNTSNLVRDGQALRYNNFVQLSLPFPSINEQRTIGAFLDHETARIDALIEEQQRLIELLKEKRQAVISHAVTKGLDPTVPMKDSGVEWLGEVPAHWKQIHIKHILNAMIDAEHKTAEYRDDGEYLVCRTTNVRNGLLSLEGAKYADRDTYIDWTRRGVPEPLDILFTREAPAGEACLVPENLKICLGQRMVLFKLDKTRIDPAFTVHSIYAGLASDFVKQLSQGSTVSHFNMADIGDIPLFEPPLPEQKEISDFLARRCDSYDLLINEAESSVKLISERRSALISAAVTGKIDVRGWQPQASAPSPELVQEAV